MREYFACSQLQRLDLSPYLPQRRAPWRGADGGDRVKLVPCFSRIVLLPWLQADAPLLRTVADLRVLPWRIPSGMISQLLLREATSGFDRHERSALNAAKQLLIARLRTGYRVDSLEQCLRSLMSSSASSVSSPPRRDPRPQPKSERDDE
jgi:hypothetical protein